MAREELKQEGVEVHLERLQHQWGCKNTSCTVCEMSQRGKEVALETDPFRQDPMALSIDSDSGVSPQLAVHHSQHPRAVKGLSRLATWQKTFVGVVCNLRHHQRSSSDLVRRSGGARRRLPALSKTVQLLVKP